MLLESVPSERSSESRLAAPSAGILPRTNRLFCPRMLKRVNTKMNWWLILVRIIHIGSAMSWFGGAVIGSFFLFPTAQALGPAGQPFMDQLMNRRRMGIFFPIVAALTVLSGAALYWRASDGLQLTWITSGSGLAFTVGGLAAIVAFLAGLALVGPSVAAQTAVQNELAGGDGVPSDAQRARLERADRMMKLATRFDLPLILLAALMMAVARYL